MYLINNLQLQEAIKSTKNYMFGFDSKEAIRDLFAPAPPIEFEDEIEAPPEEETSSNP